ncbi:hypothetical protein ACWDZ8_42730 [Streptomyces sp. NPDC003233]
MVDVRNFFAAHPLDMLMDGDNLVGIVKESLGEPENPLHRIDRLLGMVPVLVPPALKTCVVCFVVYGSRKRDVSPVGGFRKVSVRHFAPLLHADSQSPFPRAD